MRSSCVNHLQYCIFLRFCSIFIRSFIFFILAAFLVHIRGGREISLYITSNIPLPITYTDCFFTKIGNSLSVRSRLRYRYVDVSVVFRVLFSSQSVVSLDVHKPIQQFITKCRQIRLCDFVRNQNCLLSTELFYIIHCNVSVDGDRRILVYSSVYYHA